MKSRFAIALAFAIGLSVGVFVSHPPLVQAQVGTVRVKRVVPLGMDESVIVSGSVVGFACTQEDCYVASR